MRKKILVYWDYRRTDTLLPFLRLAQEFDFVFIYFRYPAEDPVNEFTFERVYWISYQSGFHLIEQTKCDAILFVELSNLYAIALNYAARGRNIPTFWMDHGIKVNFDIYIEWQLSATPKPENRSNLFKKLHTLFFYLASARRLRLRDLKLALRLPLQLKSDGERAFSRNQFEARRPLRYILFSEQNAQYYVTRDRASKREIIYIGNPFFDDFKNSAVLKTNGASSRYCLLIDEGALEYCGITLADKKEFIQKLNSIALEENLSLYVKLHPVNYNEPDTLIDSNIVYFRSANLINLINEAQFCFGMSSTVVLPLLCFGKIIIFDVNNDIQQEMKKYGVNMIDYKQFTKDEFFSYRDFDDESSRTNFETHFLYKMDGMATNRLVSILQGQHKQHE